MSFTWKEPDFQTDRDDENQQILSKLDPLVTSQFAKSQLTSKSSIVFPSPSPSTSQTIPGTFPVRPLFLPSWFRHTADENSPGGFGEVLGGNTEASGFKNAWKGGGSPQMEASSSYEILVGITSMK